MSGEVAIPGFVCTYQTAIVVYRDCMPEISQCVTDIVVRGAVFASNNLHSHRQNRSIFSDRI